MIKPILLILQEVGSRLNRSEIRERICDIDEHIAEFEQFSRALLTEMSVKFIEKSIKISC